MPSSNAFPFDTALNKATYLAPALLCATSALLFLPDIRFRDFWAPVNEKDLPEIAQDGRERIVAQQRIGDRTWYLFKLP
jgi:hypothetical protein